MKILVIAATPNELKVIKNWIKSANMKVNMDIHYLCSGVWNYETIFSLEKYLTQNPEPTFIRNIGICGYWNSINEKKIAPIQVATTINFYTGKEMVVPPFLQIAQMKKCYSSENIILEKPELKNEILTVNDEVYLDTESRWIEFIASKHKLPHVILKVPFNFIGDDSSMRKINYNNFSESIDWTLENLPYHDFLKRILVRININE